MMSAHMLEQYRRMTPRERIAEMRALMDVAARALRVLPPEERARRLAAEDRLRRSSIEALLRGLASQSRELGSRHGG
jgi:hypothetical protein